MKVIIIKLEDNYAICMKEDANIIFIERANIPKEAEEDDMLNIEGSSITIENKMYKEKYKYIDDVILDIW